VQQVPEETTKSRTLQGGSCVTRLPRVRASSLSHRTCLPTLQSLKCLALSRTGRQDDEIEAHALLDEMVATRPTDQQILGPLSHAIRTLNRRKILSRDACFLQGLTFPRVRATAFDAVALFDDAYKKAPQDEELGAQAFMSHVRVGNWKAAQVRPSIRSVA